MKVIDQFDAYKWLDPLYQPPPCGACHGQDPRCQICSGIGNGAPIFSRTHAIRREQEAAGHVGCFGVLGKFRSEHNQAITPSNCGEAGCPCRQSCIGLHLYGHYRYHSDHIREESLEYLSRLFLSARAVERRTSQLSPFQAEISNLIELWKDDTPQVAVLGAFSSGKSTLLNRLLEKSLLPATRTPTTAVVTTIRYDTHAHGIFYYKTFTRLTLLSQDARSPDPEAIQAMRIWLQESKRYGVSEICEVNERGESSSVDRDSLLRELDKLTGRGGAVTIYKPENSSSMLGNFRRAIGKRLTVPTKRLTRTFEVTFNKRQPQDNDLSSDDKIKEFGRHLTEPGLALSLQRAICFLPDKRLERLNLMDTAGLCSPVAFHKDVTAELLKRRPDKILVLLDARRLSCPTNAEALRVLKRFVSAPGDYRQVTFALTFWDLALQTHMEDDSEPELAFSSFQERNAANIRFTKSKREELAELLSSSVGVECTLEPKVFTLGLGPNAPLEMRQSLSSLWRHLEDDCSGWVGTEMWAERWRAARGFASQILMLHKETKGDVSDALYKVNDNSDNEDATERLNLQRQHIKKAFKRTNENLREIVATQKKRMLIEIACLTSKSDFVKYLDSGYWESANKSLNSVQGESKSQNAALLGLYRGARSLKIISLDRKLLGLDSSAKKEAEEEVTGFLYGLKSIWDFLLGGLKELNKSNREAAREILCGQVRSTIDIINDAVDEWAGQAQLVCEQAMAECDERAESVTERKTDTVRYTEGLNKKLRFLDNCESRIRDLSSSIIKFADSLDAAREYKNKAI